MTGFELYLLFLLGTLHHLSVGFCVFSGLSLLGSIVGVIIVVAINESNDNILLAKKVRNISLLVFIPSILINLLCPSSEHIAAIYIIPKVANSKIVHKLPDYAQKFLDAEIKKLQKEASK